MSLVRSSFLLLMLFSTGSLMAADPPDRAVPAGNSEHTQPIQRQHSIRQPISPDFFAINGVAYLHYRDTPEATATAERRMKLIQKIGARADRGDLWWSVVEPQPGSWDWHSTDQVFEIMRRGGISFLPILCYDRKGSDHSPTSDADRAAFAEYCFQTVSRYKGRAIAWEIWNEPNIPTFWKPEPSVADYCALVRTAVPAIRRADPGARIAGYVASMVDLNYLDAMGRDGALGKLDQLSIHPYSLADGPEEMFLHRQLRNVRRVLARYDCTTMPIWITEMGWHSYPNRRQSVELASAYLVMSYVAAASEGIERLFWFNVEDWEEGGHREAWGFLTPKGRSEKRSAIAYRTMVDQLTGARFEGCLDVPGAAVYAFSTPDDRAAQSGETPGQPPRASLAVAYALPPGIGSRIQPALVPPVVALLDKETRKTQKFASARNASGRDTVVVTDLFGGASATNGGWVSLTTSPVYIRLPRNKTFGELSPTRSEPDSLIVNGNLDVLERNGTPRGWNKGLFSGGQNGGIYGVEKGSVPVSIKRRKSDAPGQEKRRPEVAVTLAQTTHAVWQSWPVPCMPGERFRATASIRATSATGTNALQVQFFKGPGWGLSDAPASTPVTGTSAEWQPVTVEATCPPDACSFRVNLLSRNNTGKVAFDHVEVTAVH